MTYIVSLIKHGCINMCRPSRQIDNDVAVLCCTERIQLCSQILLCIFIHAQVLFPPYSIFISLTILVRFMCKDVANDATCSSEPTTHVDISSVCANAVDQYRCDSDVDALLSGLLGDR